MIPATPAPKPRSPRLSSPNIEERIEARQLLIEQRCERIETKLDKLADNAPAAGGGPLAALTGNPKYQWLAIVFAALTAGFSIAQPYLVKGDAPVIPAPVIIQPNPSK